MYVNFELTTKILNEDVSADGRIDSTSDENSMVNKYKVRPEGILVQDTYNNPFFPIQPKPRIDTSRADLVDIFKRFRELYSKFDPVMLPWHYIIEMIGSRYYVFNTRPLDMKFPLTSQQAVKNMSKNFKQDTKKFLDKNIFDISNAIHVCIIGDTSRDVYTKRQYEVMGRFCLEPPLRFFRLPRGLFQRIFPLNIGEKYTLDYVTKFIRK